MKELVYSIVIGGIAGWLAGKVMKGEGFGVLVNIVLGIVGGLVGGIIFSALGLYADNIIGRIVVSFVGALVIVWLARQIKS
jgi:uncharacterized membrane protein YeaQ/YmgE (transglycosylase-associated protein family)